MELQRQRKRNPPFNICEQTHGGRWAGGRAGVQVERQAHELRQSQRQVKVPPGGAEPGQRSPAHRPQAEAERQEGRRP